VGRIVRASDSAVGIEDTDVVCGDERDGIFKPVVEGHPNVDPVQGYGVVPRLMISLGRLPATLSPHAPTAAQRQTVSRM